ncbi:MAG: LysM domain-containing protein [Acidimicrobiales bacterium]
MTAIVIATHPHAGERRRLAPVTPQARPAGLALVPTGTAPAEALAPVAPVDARPALVLVPGGRAAAARRRGRSLAASARSLVPALPGAAALAVVALLLTTVAALVLATAGAEPVPAGRSSVEAPVDAPAADLAGAPAVGAADEVVPVAAHAHLVQPGDTLWGIARSLQPDGDVRPLVDELSRRVGPHGLQPGQRVSLDGLDGRAGR